MREAIWRRLGGRLGFVQWQILWLWHSKFIVSVSGLVRDDNGRVLLIKHRMWQPERRWGLPTGYAEAGESFEQTVVRELAEETGYTCTVADLVRLRSGFRKRIEVAYLAEFTGGTLRLDPKEALEAGFFDIYDLPPDMLGAHRELIEAQRPWFAARASAAGARSRPIAFVTGNRGKVASAVEHLAPLGIAVEQVALDLDEIQSTNTRAVALHKARQAFTALGRPLLVEDSGFGLDGLGGFPGPMIKSVLEAVGANGVARLADLATDRSGRFSSAVVYVDERDSKRRFCPTCGSQVCAQDDGADSICMTMSSLDNPAVFTPVAQSFMADAVAWLPAVP